jgi:hypothetical protein
MHRPPVRRLPAVPESTAWLSVAFIAANLACWSAVSTQALADPSQTGQVTARYDDTFDFTADTAALRIASDEKLATGPCGDEADDCRDQQQKLRDDTISSIDLDIRVGGRPGNDYPCECRLEGGTFKPRQFTSTMFTWKAAGYCHKPLYFEDWNLERYGHSHGRLLDPFVSAAHFFVTLPVLPYKMGVELPWECVYPLGYYRPGSCAPWTCPAVPISARGFAVQAATVTGIVFLLP